MTVNGSSEFGPERFGSGITDFTLEALFALEEANEARLRTEEAFEALHEVIGQVELLGDTSIHVQHHADMERRVVFKTVEQVINGVELPFYRIVINEIRNTGPGCSQVDIIDYSVSCSHNFLGHKKTAASVFSEGDEEIVAGTSVTGPILLIRGDRLLVDYGVQYRPSMPTIRERLTLDEELSRRADAIDLAKVLTKLGSDSHQAHMRLGILHRKP